MAQHPDRRSSITFLPTPGTLVQCLAAMFLASVLGAQSAGAAPAARTSEFQEAATAVPATTAVPAATAATPASPPVVQATAGASALQGLSVGINSATVTQLNWQCATCSEIRLLKPTGPKTLLNLPIAGPSGAVRPEDWFRIEPLPASFKPMTIKLN
jgi:hypothetical protein